MKVTVVLPSYNPGKKLPEVVNGLVEVGFDDIVVVDDGSNVESAKWFDEAEKSSFCTVIHHEQNKGKGRALKTGFEYVLKHRNVKGVVTADDDGQHASEDIMRCAQKMEQDGVAVFGVRDFKGKDIPFKSRWGNRITSAVFRFFCGIKLSDTQTGLRALPIEYLPDMLKVNGERFEYETNALLHMKDDEQRFEEMQIATIYSDNNKTSHFNPFTDSLKIYAVIIKFMASSFGCSLVDLLLFTLFNLFLPFAEAERVLVSTVLARIVSSLLNFLINRSRVFKNDKPFGKSMLRYYILCVIQMMVSYAIVFGLSVLLGESRSLWQSFIKIIVDTILFFISFSVQREWVFKKDR